ncbi:uncharacterized protein MONBRDRAFT_24259 [Monosiga brevicollis MX1]|uniref:Uncharacterized protein n=1 Tax=Monosiga brevicollis TaxID=81824 RepID=A9UVV8_MONBE|nr:uncharacterized protein MONBRDRAFT_24259 [Monosiga brevicollis MX1]EDQ90458.1 predicted protein [Monosiga brevicollis MX1]|eukprot:XP_001744509.1 hypothetical protein [Monosiga brevicollis MX1]
MAATVPPTKKRSSDNVLMQEIAKHLHDHALRRHNDQSWTNSSRLRQAKTSRAVDPPVITSAARNTTTSCALSHPVSDGHPNCSCYPPSPDPVPERAQNARQLQEQFGRRLSHMDTVHSKLHRHSQTYSYGRGQSHHDRRSSALPLLQTNHRGSLLRGPSASYTGRASLTTQERSFHRNLSTQGTIMGLVAHSNLPNRDQARHRSTYMSRRTSRLSGFHSTSALHSPASSTSVLSPHSSAGDGVPPLSVHRLDQVHLSETPSIDSVDSVGVEASDKAASVGISVIAEEDRMQPPSRAGKSSSANDYPSVTAMLSTSPGSRLSLAHISLDAAPPTRPRPSQSMLSPSSVLRAAASPGCQRQLSSSDFKAAAKRTDRLLERPRRNRSNSASPRLDQSYRSNQLLEVVPLTTIPKSPVLGHIKKPRRFTANAPVPDHTDKLQAPGQTASHPPASQPSSLGAIAEQAISVSPGRLPHLPAMDSAVPDLPNDQAFKDMPASGVSEQSDANKLGNNGNAVIGAPPSSSLLTNPTAPVLPAIMPALYLDRWWKAIDAGDFEAVQALLDIWPQLMEERRDQDQATALMVAAGLDDQDLVEVLLERESNVAEVDIDGFSALHYAVSQRASVDILDLLLEARAPMEGFKVCACLGLDRVDLFIEVPIGD